MSDLNLQQLKDYLKCVFELEGALYKHNKLVEGYTSKRNSGMPSEPVKNLPTPPSAPRLITAQQTTADGSAVGKSVFAGIVFYFAFLFAALFILLPLIMGGAYHFMVWGFICIPIGVVSWKAMSEAKKNQESKANDANALAQQNYQRELERFRIKESEAKREYDSKMQSYIQKRSEYNRETSQQLAKFEEVKNSLQNSLTKLYSQNIVYAKYRNLVAIATICEYFDSGRCTELEGPNGAYNMYEGELRSNIIICSLSQIISDLGQIKNGQYALYEQISRSNENVTHLLNNIYNAQMLTAYYAEAAAIAASADRITYGVVF